MKRSANFAATLVLAVCALVPPPLLAAPKGKSSYVAKVANGEQTPAGLAEKPGKNGWWASGWSRADGMGFHGRPESTGASIEDEASTIVIRYTRYTTNYDIGFHSPIWGAHTISRETVENDRSGKRTASNPDFERPGQFFQEPLVVALSQRMDVIAASHGTFTGTYDPRFPFVRAGASLTAADAKRMNTDRGIQRGHMVPNNAMKCQGTVEEGQTAQIESFSVANIVPQMAKSNAPTWSGLEDACFDWADELGQVWLIVGPVYHSREKATFIRKTKDNSVQVVPSPDELFYVVIGKRSAKTVVVGFLLSHEPSYIDYKGRVVTVDEIEAKTGLNFMPDLGEPNPIETTRDLAWLETKPRKAASIDDN